jgi:hypothetical protein
MVQDSRDPFFDIKYLTNDKFVKVLIHRLKQR